MENQLPNCPACRSIYAARTPKEEPPCETCRVELMEENADAGRVYHVVKRQVRVAGMTGEIIDLDYAAVKAVMDIYKITDQQAAFEKISQAFHYFLSKRQQERETP